MDVIAVDALKRAQLESDPPRLDLCEDHRPQAFGAGMGLNGYSACIEQDC
jgi:hypothetical protein